MSAAVLESRPTSSVSFDTNSSPPDEILRPSEILENRRDAFRITNPLGTTLSRVIGKTDGNLYILRNNENLLLSATPHETFTGSPSEGLQNKDSYFNQTFEHMWEFVNFLQTVQRQEVQLGNRCSEPERRHIKAADFFMANWGLPCASEVDMPDKSLLDFVGLSARGRIAIADYTAARNPSTIYAKMRKLVIGYIPQIKKLHKILYGTKITFLDFEPYVITYDFLSTTNEIIINDFEDVREFGPIDPELRKEQIIEMHDIAEEIAA